MSATVTIDPATRRGFAFDLDGVLTDTAAVHAAAWKQLFDELLARHAGGQSWAPFDTGREYRTYVDGKPRRDGLRSFLASRGISVREGAQDDSEDAETIYGLAARKNRYMLERLARDGVEVYPDAVALLRTARATNLKTAVVSASANCGPVLAAAHLTDLFDARVDGIDLARLGMPGKPAPDSFLEAARRLRVEPRRAVAFEDAIAGVQSARSAGFGLVVGVDRGGHGAALRDGGAHVVVTSLDQIVLLREATHAELR